MKPSRVHLSTKQKKLLQEAEDLKSIQEEINKEFSDKLNQEKSTLEQIAALTESIENKLQKHYLGIFPKKCNTCHKVYNNIEEYLAETDKLKHKSTIYDTHGLQEYRNCVCGSTLMLWTKDDRRDKTKYGKARRDLFDTCLEKMKKLSDQPEEEIIKTLRNIFSKSKVG